MRYTNEQIDAAAKAMRKYSNVIDEWHEATDATREMWRKRAAAMLEAVGDTRPDPGIDYVAKWTFPEVLNGATIEGLEVRIHAANDTSRVTPALRVALRNLSRDLAKVTKEIDNA